MARGPLCLGWLLILAVGCGARVAPGTLGADADGGATAFPAGTYASCTEGLHSANNNVFLGASGFRPVAALTIAQNGAAVTATYAYATGPSRSFDFALTTSTSADLARAGVTASGFSGMCVRGPGSFNFYPAALTVDHGEL